MPTITRSAALLSAAGLAVTGFASAASAAPPVAQAAGSGVCATLPAPPTASRAYADRLLAAWAAGKRPVAACYTAYSTDAVLFGEKPRGGSWTYVKTVTNSVERFDDVTYRNGAGERIVLRVAFPGSGRWDRVRGAQVFGTSGAISTYADSLIRAWGRGDRAAALKYGTRQAVDALWAFSGGPGGGCWQRSGLAGGYTTIVSYTCESALVELTVKPGAAAAGQPQAVVKAAGFGAG